MKTLLVALLLAFGLCLTVNAQPDAAQSAAKPKRFIFRATKDQIMEAQRMMKARNLYAGTETGKLDDATRAGLKKFQEAESLPATGTLNRITLEKMNIALTDKQKAMPAAPPPQVKTVKASNSTTTRAPIFRATKDQIMAAQKMMREKNLYTGAETGKLDDATRDGLKKFQTANGVKATGTLNRETLEKMGIALTDKQKEM